MTTAMKKILIATTIAATMSACMRNAPEVLDVPSRSAQQPPQGSQNSERVDAAMPIQAAMLTNYQVNLSEAKYKFTYTDFVKEDVLKFENGVATLSLKGLPAGKTGNISLDVGDNSGVKLRGGASNVTLVAGRVNNLDIKLEPVSGGNPIVVPMTTDLVINVQIDQGNTPQPSPIVAPPNTPIPNVPAPNSPSPNVPAPNSPSPNVIAPNTPNPNVIAPNSPSPNVIAPNMPAPNTVLPNVDPNIATWDGRSDRGNSRWSIVPIN